MGKNKTVIRVFWFQTLLLFLLWDKSCSTAMQERRDLFQKARWTNSCNSWSLGRIFKGSVLLTSLHFLYPTVHRLIQTHIPKPPERPVKVRNRTIIHCRYAGVGNLENTYAATYTYLINVSASLLTNFQFTAICTDEQSNFSEPHPTSLLFTNRGHHGCAQTF